MNNLKARIKATGEIVEVINYSKHSHCIEYGGCNSSGEYETKNLDEVELIVDNAPSPIDWEQRKYEMVKFSLHSILQNDYKSLSDVVEVVDRVIQQLKGGEQ